jgi:hypothetical protein
MNSMTCLAAMVAHVTFSPLYLNADQGQGHDAHLLAKGEK